MTFGSLPRASSNTWVQSGIMDETRTFAGSAADAEWGLVMTGGYSNSYLPLDTAIQTTDGKTFASLAAMPKRLYEHCLVIVDQVGVQFKTKSGIWSHT